MADKVSLHIFVVGLDEMIDQFTRGAKGMTFREVSNFEKTFEETFRAVRTKTHVDTGKLRLSGQRFTHFDGNEWSGDIEFDADPGIFELARGNVPSASHPEGGHFFFEAVEPFIPKFADNVDAVFRAIFDEKAPI